MTEDEIRSFWNRFDDLLDKKHSTLTSFCEQTGVRYKTLSTQRVRHSPPGAEQLLLMSSFLGVSMEYLLTGQGPIDVPCPEAIAVENSPELQALVRAVIKDDRILSLISTLTAESK